MAERTQTLGLDGSGEKVINSVFDVVINQPWPLTLSPLVEKFNYSVSISILILCTNHYHGNHQRNIGPVYLNR